MSTHNSQTSSARPSSSVRRRRGSAVMDAALVFPILIVLSFGSVEFGYFYFTKHTFQGAAREGARAGIAPGATNTEVTTAVGQTMTAAGFLPAQYTVAIRNATDTANVDVNTATAGTSILVKVSAPWNNIKLMTPLVLGTKNADGSARYVTGQTVMRKEG